MALGSTQPLTEMSTGSISWGGKGGRCVRLTSFPTYCAVVTKSGNLNFLEPSETVQACNGTALPLPLWLCLCSFTVSTATLWLPWLRFFRAFPCFFLSCKANIKEKPAKLGPRPAFFQNFCIVLCIVGFVSFFVLFVCKCVLYRCHRVTTQLQLTNIQSDSKRWTQLISNRRTKLSPIFESPCISYVSTICALSSGSVHQHLYKT